MTGSRMSRRCCCCTVRSAIASLALHRVRWLRRRVAALCAHRWSGDVEMSESESTDAFTIVVACAHCPRCYFARNRNHIATGSLCCAGPAQSATALSASASGRTSTVVTAATESTHARRRAHHITAADGRHEPLARCSGIRGQSLLQRVSDCVRVRRNGLAGERRLNHPLPAREGLWLGPQNVPHRSSLLEHREVSGHRDRIVSWTCLNLWPVGAQWRPRAINHTAAPLNPPASHPPGPSTAIARCSTRRAVGGGLLLCSLTLPVTTLPLGHCSRDPPDRRPQTSSNRPQKFKSSPPSSSSRSAHTDL